ncbi:type II toxin-antitoxin system death-on-curing family toxin, partial [Enterococcus faecium]|uniref:type II toxin-antitoxin system death-on-curing family toxin n=1 Tax=Enterococcus faecium TaxID=1352 RepID=UPI003CC51767
GVKDANALEMCVGQLRASAFGEEVYSSIYEKAAILLIQLIKKHPFHNAKKRTAFLATFEFLKINGQLLAIDQKVAVNLVVYIA